MCPYYVYCFIILEKSGGCFCIPSKINEIPACCQVPPCAIFHAIRLTVKLCPKFILKAVFDFYVNYFIHFLMLFFAKITLVLLKKLTNVL